MRYGLQRILIYNQSEETILISAEVPNDQTLPLMVNQETYGEELRRIEYKVDFKQMLVLSAPHSGACLHVFDNKSIEISSNEEMEAQMRFCIKVSVNSVTDPFNFFDTTLTTLHFQIQTAIFPFFTDLHQNKGILVKTAWRAGGGVGV
jgi:hypothetical protein